MADIYKFKIRLCELQNIIWRDIEITSVSSVAKLGYAVLAAFEADGGHLFNIEFNGEHYEIVFEDIDYDFEFRAIIDPIKTKLFALKLKPGDKLNLEYDYGAGWDFEIELLSISEMKRGAGSHYPYVTDGKGKGIIEDTSPDELAQIIEKTDNSGTIPKIIDRFSDNEILWDYNSFNLEDCNMFFKYHISDIQNSYEKHL